MEGGGPHIKQVRKKGRKEKISKQAGKEGSQEGR